MQGHELERGSLLALLEHAGDVTSRQLNELAYLAQLEGVPLMHQYGPYSERLDSGINWLERCGLIERNSSRDGVHDTLRLAWPGTPEQRQDDQEWRAHAEPHRETLGELGLEYHGCTPLEVHVDAALCLVASNIREGNTRDPNAREAKNIRETVIAAVSGMMPKLDREKVEARYDRLSGRGRVPG